jgi:hypothetical protein
MGVADIISLSLILANGLESSSCFLLSAGVDPCDELI